ncbi:MAG: hypothetical protein M1840_001790 [Geoglossum simile]|nr:MAG: hypothetical protein M1840_001790 [Geoglossum simile]
MAGMGSGHVLQDFSVSGQANVKIGDKTTTNITNNYTASSGPEDKILKALFLTKPTDDKSGLIAKKGNIVSGTCEWLTDRPEYKKWLSSSMSRILWLSGGPGKGKTMLSIYLTNVLEEFIKPSGGTLLYYFCDNQDPKRNTPVAILRGLLYQLLEKQSQLFKYILNDFKVQGEELISVSSLNALWRIFTTMLQNSGPQAVLCVLDGLDECEEGSLELFLKKLKDFFSTGNAPSTENFKLLVVSRDRPTCIESQLCGFDRIRLDPDFNDKVNNDIGIYISSKVRELAEEGRLSRKALERVGQSLKNGAEGTFLWVGFVADQLKGKTESEVYEILKDLPFGLDGIYKRMLRQIEDKRRESVALILQWVVLSRRPLTLTELAVATNTEGSDNQSREDMMKDRLESCGLLLRVDNNGVNLVHQSAKDYLQRDEPYDRDLEIYRVKKTEAHLVVAKICFKYIQKEPFSNSSMKLQRNERSAEVSSVLQEYPLLEYATLYWPEHSRYASDAIEDVFDFSGPFCQDESEIRENWWRTCWDSGSAHLNDAPTSFTLMHLAAYFGITPLARKITRNSWRYKLPIRNPGNKRDSRDRTPLWWAAANGYMEVVELLLAIKGVEPDSKDSSGQTPLSLAAGNGHLKVVELLLERGAKPDSKDKWDQTPLSWAAEKGQQEVVKKLLDGRVKPDSKDSRSGRTLLSRAAEKGQLDFVKLLLERGVKPDSKDLGSGRTPLLWAAERGHLEIIKLLVENGVDINAKDIYGTTALHCVASDGHKAMVSLLLSKGADIEMKEQGGRTPLANAIEYGSEAIVELLIAKGANVNYSYIPIVSEPDHS